MQHTAAMRFGHFAVRAYVIRQFKQDHYSGDISLLTDWHRYSGRRRYRLEFSALPTEKSKWYAVRDSQGNVVVHLSAAMIMRWHFDQLQQAGEQTVFAPIADGQCSRQERQTWIRGALLSALPLDEQSARAMVNDVTPHSFRPGLAGDLLAEGKQLGAIAIECRWKGPRIVRIYAERMALSDARRGVRFRRVRPRTQFRPTARHRTTNQEQLRR